MKRLRDDEGKFLSTPSARRATKVVRKLRRESKFLSTPSARRATHPPQRPKRPNRFLSTPSARRATRHRRGAVRAVFISIHALREEGDDRYFKSALYV